MSFFYKIAKFQTDYDDYENGTTFLQRIWVGYCELIMALAFYNNDHLPLGDAILFALIPADTFEGGNELPDSLTDLFEKLNKVDENIGSSFSKDEDEDKKR